MDNAYMKKFVEIYNEKFAGKYGSLPDRVRDAFLLFDRLAFLPSGIEKYGEAYTLDSPLLTFRLSIGEGGPIYNITSSQPSFILLMLKFLELEEEVGSVLEIGSGTGFVLAILSRLAKQVYGTEIFDPVCSYSREVLAGLDITNAEITNTKTNSIPGLPGKAPFDRIIVSCGVRAEFLPLIVSQLAPDGLAIVPIRTGTIPMSWADSPEEALEFWAMAKQDPSSCILIKAKKDGRTDRLIDCCFVPCI